MLDVSEMEKDGLLQIIAPKSDKKKGFVSILFKRWATNNFFLFFLSKTIIFAELLIFTNQTINFVKNC